MGCTTRSTSSVATVEAPLSIANAISGIVTGSPYDPDRDARDLNALTGTIGNNESYYMLTERYLDLRIFFYFEPVIRLPEGDLANAMVRFGDREIDVFQNALFRTFTLDQMDDYKIKISSIFHAGMRINTLDVFLNSSSLQYLVFGYREIGHWRRSLMMDQLFRNRWIPTIYADVDVHKL